MRKTKRPNFKKQINAGASSPQATRSAAKLRQLSTKANSISATAALASIQMTEEEEAKTREHLQSRFNVHVSSLSSPSAFWAELSGHAEEQKLIRVSREKYLEAISYIYSVYAAVSVAKNKEQLVKVLWETQGAKKRKKPDLIALIARTVIKYTSDEGDDAKQVRKVWNRDANVIRRLIDLKIPPYELLAYQRKHGGGLDSWNREYHQSRKKVSAKTQSEKASTDLRDNKIGKDQNIYGGDATIVVMLPDTASEGGIRIIKQIELPMLSEEMISQWVLPRLQRLINDAVAHVALGLQSSGTPTDVTEDQVAPSSRDSNSKT